MSTLAVFIALGGGAWAVTGRPADSARQRATGPISPGNSVIHACVDNRTGAARIIDRGCAGNEHRVSWVNFNGFFESDRNNSSIDIKDSGIVLSSAVAGETPQTITLTPSGLTIHAANAHLTTDGSLSLTVGHDMTSIVHGNQSSTVDKNLTSTIHGNESTTVDRNSTSTVGISNALTVGAADEETIGGLMAVSVGAGLTTSIGGDQNTTIKGDSNTKAIGGTLDTTAGTITNNADLIENLSDGNLDNLATRSLINQAGGAMLNSSGGTLTNKAVDLVNRASHGLTNQAGGNLLDKAGGNFTVQASAQAILSAPLTHLGCATGQGAARLNDPVDTSANPGSISGASTTVLVC
jgi:hypothetical protein